MHTVEKTDDLLIMRGDGPQPFIEVCKKGEKKFLFKSSFPGHHFLDQIEGEVEIILNFEKFESIQAKGSDNRVSKNLTLTYP